MNAVKPPVRAVNTPPATHRALTAVLAAALLVAACADRTPDPVPEAADNNGCGPVEELPLQSGSHLIGAQQPPVPYSSTPPTLGWHTAGALDITVHPPDDPLPEPQQVSVLEAGGVVVSYRDIVDEERLELEQHVRERHQGTVAVTPYEQLEPGQLAYTAWGTLQRCEGIDLAALDAFTAAYGGKDPDDPGTH